MKKNSIYSAILGAATTAGCFATEVFGVIVAGELLPIVGPIAAGAVAFSAGKLIFTEGKQTEENGEDVSKSLSFTSENVSQSKVDKIIEKANKDNAQIYSMITKIDDQKVSDKVKVLYDLVKKIIEAVKKNPAKLKQADKFFSYYLPTTVNFLKKYDEIENQKTGMEEMEKFMADTETMLDKIEVAFKSQLTKLYESDIMDADAEMKLFDTMLKSDGISGDSDFKL